MTLPIALIVSFTMYKKGHYSYRLKTSRHRQLLSVSVWRFCLSGDEWTNNSLDTELGADDTLVFVLLLEEIASWGELSQKQ